MCLFKDCVKFIVFTFNLIFLIIGAALITIGAIYLAHFNNVTEAIPKEYGQLDLIPILTVVVGSVIFIISFFGCCGAIKSSPCLLTTYAVILLLIFVAEIALGVFAFLEIKNEDDFHKNVNKSISDIFRKTDKVSGEAINWIQSELHCCGTTGPSFWEEIWNNGSYPKSCYENPEKPQEPNQSGCQNAFFKFLKDAARIIGIVTLGLAATEVIGATFSLCLANSVRNDIRRSGYF